MGVEQVVYLLCTSLNVGLAAFIANQFRRQVTLRKLNMTKAKLIYSSICVMQGILSTIALLFIYETLHLNFGHGAALYLILLFSFCLTAILVIAGIIVVGWEPMRW